MIWTVALAVALLGVVATAQGQRQRFTEIDVERVNIVEPDGRIALAIANSQRLPGPIIEGKDLPRELSQGREGSAGMIFLDSQGNEIGGLVYRLERRPDGTYSATRSLTFDQHNQDQVVRLQYSDNAKREALRIVVDASTMPRMEILDESGKVVYSLPR